MAEKYINILMTGNGLRTAYFNDKKIEMNNLTRKFGFNVKNDLKGVPSNWNIQNNFTSYHGSIIIKDHMNKELWKDDVGGSVEKLLFKMSKENYEQYILFLNILHGIQYNTPESLACNEYEQYRKILIDNITELKKEDFNESESVLTEDFLKQIDVAVTTNYDTSTEILFERNNIDIGNVVHLHGELRNKNLVIDFGCKHKSSYSEKFKKILKDEKADGINYIYVFGMSLQSDWFLFESLLLSGISRKTITIRFIYYSNEDLESAKAFAKSFNSSRHKMINMNYFSIEEFKNKYKLVDEVLENVKQYNSHIKKISEIKKNKNLSASEITKSFPFIINSSTKNISKGKKDTWNKNHVFYRTDKKILYKANLGYNKFYEISFEFLEEYITSEMISEETIYKDDGGYIFQVIKDNGIIMNEIDLKKFINNIK